MGKIIKGKVWKYGDDINTDVIFPGKYTYSIMTPEEMAQHALEDLDPEFAKKVQPGDVIVAGKNFGMGSSREQAAICLVAAGVGAVIAKSFARIFYRNAINNGLLAIVSPEASDALQAGDEVEIDVEKGEIRSPRGIFHFPPFPESVMKIFEDGGLIPHTIKKLKEKKAS